MSIIEVKVPALGDFKDVPVIDVLVKAGDEVKTDDPLVTLESDKATMDVPSPAEGKIRELKVKTGDRVSEGSLVLTLEANGAARTATPSPTAGATPTPTPTPTAPSPRPSPARGAEGESVIEVRIPPIGDFKDVPVIDVLVKPGDEVSADAPLVTLESDKATMDVPSPSAGTVRELRVKIGDRVGEGTVIAVLAARQVSAAGEATTASPRSPSPPPGAAEERAAPRPPPRGGAGEEKAPPPPSTRAKEEEASAAPGPAPHASPSVRKLARELGVDLARVEGGGPKGRILQADVQRFVKATLARAAAPGAGGALELAPWPKVDFARFGPVETQPLSRIRKLSRAHLSRNWVMIPHVTQHDEADVTDLERFRRELGEEAARAGVKVTLLAFLVKACVAALRRFPEVNASLDGDQLVLKRYYHIGFAADTPQGLVVPVLRDADRKGVLEVAKELAELAAKAREGKLAPADVQGGSFSISSLGGIGGTAFTPIINAPEVAILGVSRSATRPVWDGEKFVPRLMLPLSLSYDHRVVDGALAARFTTYLAQVLADMRRAML